MSPRILIVVGLIDLGLTRRLAPALLAAGAVFVAAGTLLLRRPDDEPATEKKVALSNPLDIEAVLKFGALLSFVMILSKVAMTVAGSAGAYVLAALSGLADVDAIALTMVRLGRVEIGPDDAMKAILLAAAVNTAAKAAMGWYAGGARMGLILTTVSVLAIAAGGAALLLTPPT